MHEYIDERRWIALTDTPLDLSAAYAFLQTEAAGAINLFVGTTRRWTQGLETQKLFYEAHEPMAIQEAHKLLDEAFDRWPVLKACLIHRLGEVPIGQASVIIGVSCPHRDASFTACRWLIDRLKKQIPIWKQEHFADGTTHWTPGQLPDFS